MHSSSPEHTTALLGAGIGLSAFFSLISSLSAYENNNPSTLVISATSLTTGGVMSYFLLKRITTRNKGIGPAYSFDAKVRAPGRRRGRAIRTPR